MRQFVLRWIGGTILGWIMALLLWFILASIPEFVSTVGQSIFGSAIKLPVWADVPLLILGLIGAGATVGLAQTGVALKGQITTRGWIIASAVSVVTLYAGLSVTPHLPIDNLVTNEGGALSGMDAVYKAISTWPITVLTLGTILGATFGLPTWLLLRRYVDRASLWLVANILGAVAIFASFIALVTVLGSTVLSDSLICCPVGPTIFATITGAALFRLLQRHVKTPVS